MGWYGRWGRTARGYRNGPIVGDKAEEMTRLSLCQIASWKVLSYSDSLMHTLAEVHRKLRSGVDLKGQLMPGVMEGDFDSLSTSGSQVSTSAQYLRKMEAHSHSC
jgi:hypothetical protein